MNKDEYLHRLAQRELVEGRLYEPRLYFDPFTFDGSTEVVYAHPSIFRNGEKYPLRITHLLMAAAYEAAGQQIPGAGGERKVQRDGLRPAPPGHHQPNSGQHPPPPPTTRPPTTRPCRSTRTGPRPRSTSSAVRSRAGVSLARS